MSEGLFTCSGCGIPFDRDLFVSYLIDGIGGLELGSDSLLTWLCCRQCWDSRGLEFRRSVVDAVVDRLRSLVIPVRLTYTSAGVVESPSDRVRYNRQISLLEEVSSSLRSFCESGVREVEG